MEKIKTEKPKKEKIIRKKSSKEDVLKLDVYDQKGEKIKTTEIPADIFGVKSNPSLIAQALRIYIHNKNIKTASTKTRSEVRGGGRKPHRQKGTGRARAGSTRSPGRVGAGVVFGPISRKDELGMSRKMKLKALSTALSERARDQKIRLIEKISFKEPQTKKAHLLLNKILPNYRNTLVILEKSDEKTVHSFNNLKNADTSLAIDLNVFDVVKSPSLLITLDAFEILVNRFGEKNV